MWQFAETVRGLADGCLELGLPVTGGNVSFYNQTGSVAILPTPVIAVLGVIQDVRERTPMGISQADLDLYLIGPMVGAFGNFAGSEWAYLHGQLGFLAPNSDLQLESRLVNLLLEGQSIFESAHDISNGGLAATISEMVLRHGIGATISLTNIGPELLSESPGRVLVALNSSNRVALSLLAEKYRIPITKIGTTGGTSLIINDAIIALDELRTAFTDTFRKLFG
jgi:phosphoribosylformylglycinamidine (FGAM) synthase-like enzyme